MSQPAHIDPRGHRFAGALTTVVVAAAIVALEAAPVLAVALIGFQLVVFAIGGFFDLSASPYARLYAKVLRPRIGPPSELEESAPPVFSQVLGTIFGVVALLAIAAGATTVAYVALSFALLAALLNAAIGLCLGCELYLVLQRLQTSKV